MLCVYVDDNASTVSKEACMQYFEYLQLLRVVAILKHNTYHKNL